LWLSRSWTTRPPRPGEAPDAYVFVDRDAFLRHAEAGGFLEYAQGTAGDDNLYGTPMPHPPPGRDVLLEIDVQGAEQVLARDPDALVILVVPPSRDAQEARLRARGDDDAHIRRRLAMSAHEEEVGRRLASAVVVNDDLERAVDEVAAIVERRRHHRG
jgi:guanylate kinase